MPINNEVFLNKQQRKTCQQKDKNMMNKNNKISFPKNWAFLLTSKLKGKKILRVVTIIKKKEMMYKKNLIDEKIDLKIKIMLNRMNKLILIWDYLILLKKAVG